MVLPPAQAQDRYPNRPVKIIVPTVAGGTVDVITRLVANDLSSRLGASFFVDNRSGAGNTLGSREAARAEADGYTLLMSSASGQVISPLVYRNVDYDAVKSFAPIGLVAEGSIILVINPSLPFKSVPELVAYAKANPGKLNYGSAGTGTLAAPGRRIVQVGGRRRSRARPLSRRCAVDRRRDRRQRSTDVRGSEPAARAHPRRPAAGARGAEQGSPRRSPRRAELGRERLPTVAATTWTGLFAPAGTDKAIVDKLNAGLNEGLRSAELKAALARVGNAPLGGTPDALTRMLLAENARWAPIVKALNLKAD